MTAGFSEMTVQRNMVISVAAGVSHALDMTHLVNGSSDDLKEAQVVQVLRSYVGAVWGFR